MAFFEELKKKRDIRLNDRQIARVREDLSILADSNDSEKILRYEKELTEDILRLSTDYKNFNSDLTQPLHLYFASLYQRGRLSIDKSAHDPSIELFTDFFLANRRPISDRFYYINLQKVVKMLILANLSIHRVQNASKLLDTYEFIMSETYKTGVYLRIMFAPCGSLPAGKIKKLFDKAPETYVKECTTVNNKAAFLKDIFLISRSTLIDIPGFPELLEDICRRAAGTDNANVSAMFFEFCSSREYAEEAASWLGSLGPEALDKKYNKALRRIIEGVVNNEKEIPVAESSRSDAETQGGYTDGRIRKLLIDKDYPLDRILEDIDKTRDHYRTVAEGSADLNERLTAASPYQSLVLLKPSVNYWNEFEKNYLKIVPDEQEKSSGEDKVFFFVNEYSLVNGAVSFPFFLEARRRGIPCYSVSPRIHLDAADPEDSVYDLYGNFSGEGDIRFYPDKDISDVEIDIDNKRIVVDGMNIYQPVFEFVSRYQFTYHYRFDTDAWARYRTVLLIRVFRNLFRYIEKIEKWAVENGRKVYFVSNAPHLHNAAAFRIYCEERGYRNGLYYICTSPGYDNYFANASDPRTETTTALNLTKNIYCRNSFLGTREGFEKYYRENIFRIEDIRNKMRVHLEAQRGRNRAKELSEEKEKMIARIEQARSEGKTVILLNGKVIIDLAVKYTQGVVHGDMSEWITHAVAFAKEHSDRILLLIKPHPHENREDLTLTSEKIDNLRSLITCDLGDNTIYLDNDMFTNNELINYMDLGMVWNGTSALEFAAQGKKVLVADVWGHYDYPIGFVRPETLEEYESYMLDPCSMNEPEDIGDRAITFLEYMGSDSVRIPNHYSRTTLMNFNQYESTIDAEAVDRFAADGDPLLKEYFDNIL